MPNPFEGMTPEQFLEELKRRGAPSEKSRWGSVGGRTFEPSSIGAQKRILEGVKEVLEAQMEIDAAEVAAAKMRLARILKGGGV